MLHLFIVAECIIALLAYPSSSLGKQGGQVFQGSGQTAQISVSQSDRTVTLELDRTPEGHPKAIEISLRDRNNQSLDFVVSALSKDGKTYVGKIPEAPGSSSSLSLDNQSFIGIELRIPLSKRKSRVVRLDRAN